MDILYIGTESFRNLASGRVEFHPRLNLIVGDNGQGKTNLLEAIAVVSGRASFRSGELSAVHWNGAAVVRLMARVRDGDPGGSGRRDGTLAAVLSDGQREHSWEGERISRLLASRHLPAVFLTGQDLNRLTGPPADRRRALDRAALAGEPALADTLRAYERARLSKQRLLTLRNGYDADELAVYEETLACAGGRIAAARRGAVAAVGREIARHAAGLGARVPDLTLELASDLSLEGTPESFGRALRTLMRERKVEERRAARCLVGPHRDDVILKTGGVPAASRVSSGENRTLVLAWTLAEGSLLAAACGRVPLLLFDDFDSEWDPGVLAAFAEGLPDEGQVFLTSAREEAVRGLPLPGGVLLRVTAGRLAREGILGGGRARTRWERAVSS